MGEQELKNPHALLCLVVFLILNYILYEIYNNKTNIK